MRKLSRRQALSSLGTVSLGAVLAACGDDTTAPSGAVTTTDGRTATVEAKAAPGGALSPARFDSSATCQVAAELTEGP